MKHIEVDHRFIRDQVIQGSLVINHVSSADQVVDCLTKALPATQFSFRPKVMFFQNHLFEEDIDYCIYLLHNGLFSELVTCYLLGAYICIPILNRSTISNNSLLLIE